MNTEAKVSLRKDALVAAAVLGALGVLWILFRLYWQGTLLLVAAGLVAFLGARRARLTTAPSGEPTGEPSRARPRAEPSRRGKKRKRRK